MHGCPVISLAVQWGLVHSVVLDLVLNSQMDLERGFLTKPVWFNYAHNTKVS